MCAVMVSGNVLCGNYTMSKETTVCIQYTVYYNVDMTNDVCVLKGE